MLSRALFLSFTLTVWFAIHSPSLGQFTWDGSCSTDNWHTCCAVGELFDNNWELDPGPQCPPFPGANDDVDLNGANVRLAVQPADIRSLFNGELILAHSLGVTEFVNLGGLTMISHDITAGGDIIISGPLTWRSGTLAGPPGSRVGANGPITITDLGNAILDRRTLTANAPVSWTGTADIVLDNGAVFDNRVSLSLTNNERIGGGGGTFLNKAPFGKADSSGETTVLGNVFFDNTDLGSIDVATGTLKFEGGGQSRGAISVNDGATIRFATFGSRTFTIQTNTTVASGGLIWVSGSGPGLSIDDFEVGFSAARMLVTGVLRNAGVINLGELTWTSGTFTGDGSTLVDGMFLTNGGLSRAISGQSLLVGGDSVWDGSGRIAINGGGISNSGSFTILNEPKTATLGPNASSVWDTAGGGTLDVLTDTTFAGSGAARFQISGGTVNVGPGVTLCDFNGVEFINVGTAHVQSGKLRIRGGRSESGTFSLEPGTTLELLSRLFRVEPPVQFTGDGIVRVGAGGTLELAPSAATDIPNVELIDGGIITGPSDLKVTARLDWTQGQMTGTGKTIAPGTFKLDESGRKILSERTLRNEGDATWSGGDLILNNAAKLENAPGARFDIRTDGFMSHDAGDPASIENDGFILRSAGGAQFTFPSGAQFNNRGVLDVQFGTVSIRGPGTSSGRFDVAQDASVEFTSAEYILAEGAGIQGSGTARLTGGFLTIQGANVPIQNLDLAFGTLDGPGAVRIPGTLLWTSASMRGPIPGATLAEGTLRIEVAALKLLSARSLVNSGTGSIAGGVQLRLDNLAELVNAQGATLTLELDDGAISLGHAEGSRGRLFNRGTLEVMSTLVGGCRLNDGVELVNDGSVRIGGRAGLFVAGGGEGAGSFSLADEAVLKFLAGVYQCNAGTRFIGQGVLSPPTVTDSGVLRINGDVEAEFFRVNSGGTLEGLGTLTVTNFLELFPGVGRGAGAIISSGGAVVDGFTLDLRRLDNDGEMRFPGDLTLANGAVLNNRGRAEMSGSTVSINGSPNEVFNNFGEFEPSAALTTVRARFFNLGGTVRVREGKTLRFAGPYSQTSLGRLIVERFAIVIFDEPPFIADTTRIEGESLIRSPGGPIRSSGTAAPGQSPGTLTIEGDYIQEPGGEFEIELGGLVPDSEHDVFEVTGDAELGGTLEILLIDGFEPQVGDQFTVMNYGAHTGEFAVVSVPCGYEFSVHYNATDVTLEVTGVGVFPPGDIDGDCDVDLADHELFYGCMGGPGVTDPPKGCDLIHFSRADFEIDDDVDLGDFTRLQPRIGS
jgi:hypothetical protein